MAHTKAKGSSKLGRDSQAKRLGVKVYGGAKVAAGQVLVRQRGTAFHPGENVARGSDDTLFALRAGTVVYKTKMVRDFRGTLKNRRFVKIEGN